MAQATIEEQATGRTALLIIDMINDMAFDGGEQMLPRALAAADHILTLRAAARAAGVPVVYVNDNYGQWHSERSKLIAHCARPDAPGRELAQRLAPGDDDYFIIKPMHSGFYATNLQVLLPRLGASRLIVTGLATEVCVLFTAADAHMRAYEIWVPCDCTTGVTEQRRDWALEIMRESMGASTREFSEEGLASWLSKGSDTPADAAR